MGENKIKYQKSVAWFKPFVESVADLVDLNRISSIRGFRVRKGYEEKTYGSAIKYKRKFSINIKMWNYIKATDCYRRRTMAGVLEILAHELAHIHHWDHSPDHWRLQAQIQLRFTKVFEKFGIVDTSVRITPNIADQLLGQGSE
jgi:hypothetical protein